jgi:DtxR family Mn-dependent transcriptional regulator
MAPRDVKVAPLYTGTLFHTVSPILILVFYMNYVIIIPTNGHVQGCSLCLLPCAGSPRTRRKAFSLGKKHLSDSMALYLAEIYRLDGEKHYVASSDLADELHVSSAAVSRMAERLHDAGFVERIPYKGIRLTPDGVRQGLRMIRSHRLAEVFLVRVMEYGWHEAHDMADRLALAADDDFVTRMDEKAGFPRRCPHGEPIPSLNGVMPEIEDIPMPDMEQGEQGSISRVKVREEDKLLYLEELGLVPEAWFRIEAKVPFDGPIRLQLTDREIVVGRELSQQLRVLRADPS